MTLGGDGTILYAASHFQSKSVPPILGFYMGTLGFMCNNKIGDLEKVIMCTMYQLLGSLTELYEERIRVEGEVEGSKFTSMNEIAVSSRKTMLLDIYVNG